MAPPERQCVGCGKRGPQAGFVRLVLDPEAGSRRVIVDRGKGRRGRSAYLCPSQACLERALRRKAFNRAFRTAVVLDEPLLRAAVAANVTQNRPD